MSAIKYLLPISFALLLLALPVQADFTVNLDAGELTAPLVAPMQADDSSAGSLNGSLLLLLDLGSSDGTVSNAVTAGNFVSEGNIVLAAGGFNTYGGTNETLTAFDVSSPANASVGDQLALRWFPQITLAQFESGTLPTSGDYYGTYNPTPNGSTPDGGDPWTLPTGGLIDLNLYTTDSDYGGSQLPSAGLASFQVIAEVPEPSTYALLGVGLCLLLLVVRRTRRNGE